MLAAPAWGGNTQTIMSSEATCRGGSRPCVDTRDTIVFFGVNVQEDWDGGGAGNDVDAFPA